jgi:hypothetical protein
MSQAEASTEIESAPRESAAPGGRGFSGFAALVVRGLPAAVSLAVAIVYGLAMWIGIGGYAGLNNGWPIWRDDHPLYLHSAIVTRDFLRLSHTTAGYDPSFMAGYAKSVVFPASSTAPELVVAAFGGNRPERAYKIFVLLAAAAPPWLIAASCRLLGVRGWTASLAVLLGALQVWTDWPINYVMFGMLPYFLGVPMALLATSAFAAYLDRRTTGAWLLATAAASLAFLVHLTTAMLIAPAALVAYVAASWRRGEGQPMRLLVHLGVWLIPVVVLAVNGFWWYPGVFLGSTKGDSSFAFSHSNEWVIERLANIAWKESPAQVLLLGAGIPGLVILLRRPGVAGAALLGFCAAGMAWGYLAGAIAALDFLQPGRHTFALYEGLAIASAVAIVEAIRRRGDGLARWLAIAWVLFGVRALGPALVGSVQLQLYSREPFLSSRPSPRLIWVAERVAKHVKPGERLLYEEGGKDLAGIADPYQRGRFSGLLAQPRGIELIGGPYLRAAVTTNFTQFGEGKLFGRADWDRDFFVRYARLYRPSAILCWSPHARAFCRANSDLIRILEDDGIVMIGRVEGFGGDTIRGKAEVEAAPGRLRVTEMVPDPDGSVVLRYHFVPCQTTSPPVACEPEPLEGDPVPFIRLRPTAGIHEVELKMAFPGWP